MSERMLYHFGPRPTRGVMLGLGVAQLVALGLGALMGVLLFHKEGLGLGLVPMALAGIYAWVPVAGRPIYEWSWPLLRHGLGLVLGEQEWHADAKKVRPSILEGLEVVAAGGARPVGVVVARSGGSATYTAVLAVRGSDFSLLETGEQDKRLARWGEVLSGLAVPKLGVRRVQWVERSGPERADTAAAWALHHRVAPAGSAPALSYAGLVRDARPHALRHDTWLCIQVAPRRADPDRGAEDPALEQVLAALNVVKNNLASAQLREIAALDPTEVGEAVRSLLDPDYARVVSTGRSHLRMVKEGLPTFSEAETTWSAYRCDSTWHATYWVAELPRRAVGASWLGPMLLARVPGVRSVSVIMDPMSPSAAAHRVEREVLEHNADTRQRDRLGFDRTARRERERAGAEARAEELVSGYAVMRLSALVSVACATRGELEEAARSLEQAAGQAGLELRLIYGQQDRALLATLPLCAGLAQPTFGIGGAR